MTVSSYPVSTADHVLPPYANPNGISALSTGTFSANNYSQAYVGGRKRNHCASKRYMKKRKSMRKSSKSMRKSSKSMRKLVKTRSAKKLYKY